MVITHISYSTIHGPQTLYAFVMDHIDKYSIVCGIHRYWSSVVRLESHPSDVSQCC